MINSKFLVEAHYTTHSKHTNLMLRIAITTSEPSSLAYITALGGNANAYVHVSSVEIAIWTLIYKVNRTQESHTCLLMINKW